MSNVAPFRRKMSGQPDLPAGRIGGMLVILLASPATGSGRTMLAAHMAVQAGLTGDGPVGLLDTDPKGALFQWWSRRRGKVDEPVYGALCDVEGLAVTLDAARAAGARLCIIDTGVGDEASLTPAAALADLVVVPSGADAAGAGQAGELGRALSKQATIAFVTNGRAHSGVEDGNALAAVGSGGGWPAGAVQHANAFAIAMAAGRSVSESHAETCAAGEIAELWANLRGILVAG